MKKFISSFGFILILLIFFQVSAKSLVNADWWERPTAQPTQPSFNRDLIPTTIAHPTQIPTSAPSQPTVPPTNPPTGGVPETGGGGSGSGDDACGAGKSYTGPYCGWSPDVNNSGGGGGGTSESPRIGEPQVLGLSNTSSSDVALSDIMILAGVLCLTLYARSKLTADNRLQ